MDTAPRTIRQRTPTPAPLGASLPGGSVWIFNSDDAITASAAAIVFESKSPVITPRCDPD